MKTRVWFALVVGLGLTLAVVWALGSANAPTALAIVEQASDPSGLAASVIRVATTGADAIGCGSIITPCRTAQYAVDQAVSGDEIRVATGVYTGVQARASYTQVVYITKSLTIQGGYTTTNWTTPNPSAYTTTLDAKGRGRVFFITGSGITVTISNVIIANGLGQDGGGIVNLGGTLNVTNCTFSGNGFATNGGGIFNYNGAASVSNSTFSSNNAARGGGIYNYHYYGTCMLTVTGVAFSGNSALSPDGGGGIFNDGPLNVTNSTFSGNTASAGNGGGITNWETLAMTGSTFFSNTAMAGGGIENTGALTVTGSTFTNNTASDGTGGGICNHDSLNVTGSTFSDNSATYGGGIHNFNTLAVAGSTFSGNSVGEGGGIDNEGTGVIRVAVTGMDAMGCGSVIAPCRTVQYAVDQAASGDEIRVATGVYTGVSVRAGITQAVYISQSVTLRGGYTTANWTTPDPVANPTTLDAQGKGRVLYIAGAISPTVEGLRITGGNATGLGGGGPGVDGAGGIYVDSATVSLSDCEVFSNTAGAAGGLGVVNGQATLVRNAIHDNRAGVGDGGGLVLHYSSGVLSANIIYSNTAYGNGGGLLIEEAPNTASLAGNTIVSNTAGANGGGLYLYHTTISFSGNTIRGNHAITDGGGLLTYQSGGTLSDNTIGDNDAGVTGGGLYVGDSPITLTANTIMSNTARTPAGGRGGGGLFVQASPAVITGNTIVSNTTYGNGGGVHVYDADAMLSGNTIRANHAGQDGGGVWVDISDGAMLSANTVSSNTANTGGGVVINNCRAAVVSNTIGGNSTSAESGGLYLRWSDSTVSENIIVNNVAGDSCGGLGVLYSNAPTLINNVIADNQASVEGSGVCVWVSSPRFLHTTIARNSGGDGSGISVSDDGEDYSTAVLTNTILVSHTVGISVTGGNTVTVNAILWDSSTPITVSKDVTAVVTIQHQYVGDPAFAADGYHLTEGSAAIDRGVNAGITTDIDGDPRPLNTGYDLGADEILVVPIAGLSVVNNSPTPLGSATRLTATVTSGSNVAYSWALGDGAVGSGSVVTHVYPAIGIYTAVVTASNSISVLTKTMTVTITEVPIIGLVATNDGPTPLGQATRLTATVAAGTNIVYAWAFGDGQFGSGAVVTHTYPAVGIYTAIVTASNPVSVVTAMTTVIVDANIAGLAAFNNSPKRLEEAVTLTATVTAGSHVAYAWALGDGTSGSGAIVAHVYPVAGIYSAIVTATNSVSVLTATTTVTIYHNCWARLNDDPTDYPTVQTAIDASTQPTDVVKVAGICPEINHYGADSQIAYINKTLTIRGGYTTTNWIAPDAVANPTTLDAQGQGRVIRITGSITPTLESLRMTRGSTDVWGGGIYADAGASPMISGCRVLSNTAGYGGGLHVFGANIRLVNNTVDGNTAGEAGGLYLYSGASVTLIGNKVHDNRATDETRPAGGVWIASGGGPITLTGNQVYGNSAAGSVGGVYIQGGSSVWVMDNQVYSNTTEQDDGGIAIENSRDVRLVNNALWNNSARYGSGGLYVWNPQQALVMGNVISGNYGTGLYYQYPGSNPLVFTAISNTIYLNISSGGGGGVVVVGGSATLAHNQIYSNSAADEGGGLAIYNSTGVTVTANQIYRNTSGSSWGGGGGIYVYNSAGVTLTNNVILENRLTGNGDGAGLYLDEYGNATGHHEPTWVRSLHNTLARNTGGHGQGVYVQTGATLYMTNTILVSHAVGISVTSGSTVTVNAILWDAGTPITISKGITAVVSVQNQTVGNPAFAADGYHLTTGSAAIDAGVNAGVNSDIDGEPRPVGAGYDIGADESMSSAPIAPSTGGGLVYTNTQGMTTTVQIPAGAVTNPVTLVFAPVPTVTAPGGLAFAGHAFELAAYQGINLLPGFVFQKPVTITLHYSDADVVGLDELLLRLEYWNGSAWVDAACGPYARHPTENWLAVPICHLSQFALFEVKYRIYLPVVLRQSP